MCIAVITGTFGSPNSKKTSELSNVLIRGTKGINKEILNLSGAIVFYNANVKALEVGLVQPNEFSKPTITWEEIHEKTHFSNVTAVIDKILEIPNLEIKGERPPRENFGG